VYSDNSREIKQAVRWLGFAHRTSIPGIPANNAIAESRVKIVVYGTRTALVNAGLPAAFWPYSARHVCLGLTIRDRGGASAYEKQLGEPFPGMRIPFGCKVFFKPSPLSKSQPKKFEGQAVPGLFFGYKLDPGGKWSGEYLLISLDAMVTIPLHRKTPAAQLRVHVQSVEEALDVKEEDVFSLSAKPTTLRTRHWKVQPSIPACHSELLPRTFRNQSNQTSFTSLKNLLS
jgi:hypothetical protein